MANRRRFLAAVTASGIAGCTNAPEGGGSETGGGGPGYIDDPNVAIDFAVTDHTCLEADPDVESINEARIAVDQDENVVTVEGTITDGERGRTAELDDVLRRADGPELRFVVRTREDAAGEDCPTSVDYSITMEYRMEEYQEYAVYHNSRTAARASVEE